jgi:hypothetical protein
MANTFSSSNGNGGCRPSASTPPGLPQLDSGSPDDEAIKKEIRLAVRWLVEQVQPGVEAVAPPPPPTRLPQRRKRRL